MKNMMQQAHASGNPQAVNDAATKAWEVIQRVGHAIPDIQRFNLLASRNLPINMWVGPWGSGVFNAVEKILSGDQRGYQMLKGYFSGNFGREWWKSMNEAGDRLEHHDGREPRK
jgi:hypothetical protein